MVSLEKCSKLSNTNDGGDANLPLLLFFLSLNRDAWAKRKGLASQDAKQLYVESMLRVSRKARRMTKTRCMRSDVLLTLSFLLSVTSAPHYSELQDSTKVQRSTSGLGTDRRVGDL